MANTSLKLYTGTTPNTDGVHVYFTSFANYLTHLSSHLLATISMDNYRVNALVIKVALGETLTLANYKTVTYAVHDLDNVCYYVKSAVVQSGYVIFDVDIDYWGTYIATASFDNINVLRCNRRIGTGLYDDIRATNTMTPVDIPTPAGHYPTGYPAFLDLDDVYIVFVLTYNVEQTPFGSVSATEMLAFRLDNLYDTYAAQTGANPQANAVDIAVGVVGGIYAVDATNAWGFAMSNDAKVTKAYLVHRELIEAYADSVVTVKSQSMYGKFTSLSTYGVSKTTKSAIVSLSIDPDYNYYVGTTHKGLKVIRTTDLTTNVTYRCVATATDVQVVVIQGDNQMDITSEFEVVLTINAGDITNLAGIKAVLGTTLKSVGALASGNIGGAVGGVAGEAVSMIGRHYHGSQSGNGDGILSYRKGGNATLYLGAKYPFGYVKCKSINNEQENAKYKGAFFDAYVSTLSGVFTPALLYGSAIPTYVQANVTISNLPERAQAIIKQSLARGVYMISV